MAFQWKLWGQDKPCSPTSCPWAPPAGKILTILPLLLNYLRWRGETLADLAHNLIIPSTLVPTPGPGRTIQIYWHSMSWCWSQQPKTIVSSNPFSDWETRAPDLRILKLMMSRGTKLTMIMTGIIIFRLWHSSFLSQPELKDNLFFFCSLNLSESSSVTTVREQAPQAANASLQVKSPFAFSQQIDMF